MKNYLYLILIPLLISCSQEFNVEYQSRNTIQTLINLKQPNKTAFIKQQTNMANGHQQINNGAAQSSPEKFSNMTNELLEEKYGEWLDAGTKAKADRVNTELEAVAEVHRGKDSKRKSKVQ